MIWLLLLVVLLVAFVALAADDSRWGRRRLPPVKQPRPHVPCLPQTRSGAWNAEFHLNRGRRVRAARARSRHQRQP